MAMDAQVKSLLLQTIAVAAPSGVGNTGEASYGTPANRSARVVTKTGVTISADNEEIAYSYEILTESEIVRYSRIWLPGVSSSDAKKALLALNTEQVVGEVGESLGWWTKA